MNVTALPLFALLLALLCAHPHAAARQPASVGEFQLAFNRPAVPAVAALRSVNGLDRRFAAVLDKSEHVSSVASFVFFAGMALQAGGGAVVLAQGTGDGVPALSTLLFLSGGALEVAAPIVSGAAGSKISSRMSDYVGYYKANKAWLFFAGAVAAGGATAGFAIPSGPVWKQSREAGILLTSLAGFCGAVTLYLDARATLYGVHYARAIRRELGKTRLSMLVLPTVAFRDGAQWGAALSVAVLKR